MIRPQSTHFFPPQTAKQLHNYAKTRTVIFFRYFFLSVSITSILLAITLIMVHPTLVSPSQIVDSSSAEPTEWAANH